MVRPIYRPWIPGDATEHVVETHPDGSRKVSRYDLNGEVVGYRNFGENGRLEWELPQRDGQHHGLQYQWHESGALSSIEPYRAGLPHGTARQWNQDGILLGEYTMRRGTGIDLWWQDWEDGTVDLAEVHPKKDGDPHGFEWWFYSNRLCRERHWWHGRVHGIEREWNFDGRLRRGFPKYWINGEQVDRRKYLRAAAQDDTLPPFLLEENDFPRVFPPEIARVLHRRSGRRRIAGGAGCGA